MEEECVEYASLDVIASSWRYSARVTSILLFVILSESVVDASKSGRILEELLSEDAVGPEARASCAVDVHDLRFMEEISGGGVLLFTLNSSSGSISRSNEPIESLFRFFTLCISLSRD